MKYVLFTLLLILPTISYGEVQVKNLSPVVKFKTDSIHLTTIDGKQIKLTTHCKYDIEKITHFSTNRSIIKEGIPVKISRNKVCRVKSLTVLSDKGKSLLNTQLASAG